MSSSEIKNYLHVSDSVDDALITSLSKAALSYIEIATKNTILKEQYKQTIYNMNTDLDSIQLRSQASNTSISVVYYDVFDSTSSALTINTDYQVIGNKLFFSDGYIPKKHKYEITYYAGMYDSSNYDNDNDTQLQVYKICMLRLISYVYDNRALNISTNEEENYKVEFNLKDVPFDVKYMLSPYVNASGIL